VALAFAVPASAVASSSVIIYGCAPNLCRVNPDGTGMTQLTSDGRSGTSMAYGAPSLSRDGSKLAFAFDNHIFVSDANANNRSAPFASTGLIALMRPDGGQLAELEQTLTNPPIQLCTYSLDGSGRSCLYATPSAGWAPDNNLLISTQPGLASNEQICHVSAAVNQPCSDVRADDPANDLYDPAVSPDGSTLAVTVAGGIGGPVTGHIALYDYATGQLERNLTNGTTDSRAVWSPDGSQLAFERDSASAGAIYTIAADGVPGSERLLTGGDSPTWGSGPTVTPAPSSISPPTISGTARQGDKLAEAHGSWSNSPTAYGYQWEDCENVGNVCSAIVGATSQSYTLTAENVGHTIRVQETATNAGGTGGPVASTATGIVQASSPPPTGKATASHASLSGLRKREAKLRFALSVSGNAPAIKTITIALPKGLGFSTSKKRLPKEINVKGSSGKKLKFTAKVSHGKLTITLRTAASSLQTTIVSPAINVSKTLADKVKHHKIKTLRVAVTAVDAGHTTNRLTLKLTAG
jgi:Tol biopolymer transport system component